MNDPATPGLRVLLVDDNPDDRALAKRAVLRELPEVRFTEPLDAQALQQALAGTYDAVITDYRLGWSDGLKVLAEVKCALPGVPVIMFTNTGNEEVCAEGLRQGLYDYLVKRLDQYPKLPQALRRAVLQARQAAELERHRDELERRQTQLALLLQRESAAREEAERARAEAQLANRLKDDFLATLSHELRTPLSSMLGWSQLLLKKPDDPAVLRRGLETIQRNTRAQARLIDDLLDLSRIVSGKLRLQPEQMDLSAAGRAALDSVAPQASQAGVVLEAQLDLQASALQADPLRVQQIIANLLSNAVKFTPAGGRVTLSTQRWEGGAEIRVSDTGEGIAPEFLPHLFDGFRQADSSARRQHQGLGIGLAIVKKLVALHGGDVSAHSAGPGHGAQFVVRLPDVAAPLQSADASAGQNPGTPSLHGLRVLVVEDDHDTRDVIAALLTDAGAQVRLAANAPQGLEAMKSAEVDVLLSDIGMPGMDGHEFIAAVRALPDPRRANVPAAALTAFAQLQDRERALAAGFDRHAAKPLEPQALLTLVAQLAAQHHSPSPPA